MKKSFTKQQVDDWKRYEKVRAGGKWNMFDPMARRATGLSEKAYEFVMSNYSKLREAASHE